MSDIYKLEPSFVQELYTVVQSIEYNTYMINISLVSKKSLEHTKEVILSSLFDKHKLSKDEYSIKISQDWQTYEFVEKMGVTDNGKKSRQRKKI